VSITSNEPTAKDDIQGFDPQGDAFLRATRLGNGTGRIYSLKYQGFDHAGNSAFCMTTVTVPKDQAGGQ